MAEFEPRGELGYWVRARRYRNRAEQSLRLAATAPTADSRIRAFRVAEHYLTLAQTEEKNAKEAGLAASPSRGSKYLSRLLERSSDSGLRLQGADGIG